ncbi:hypothetical protein GP486_004182 [Trichoglossum hirsutum]|uniref:Uncharacterized protein n=1 Tax=Trichoglossum hirsutum TaxID=265104 RepID=A0A9P8LBK2_9PEZI|nr:hypothetical protein GP486_004182 [Trichoglossum hirsutum]
MSDEGSSNHNTEEKFPDSETRVGGHDKEQARHFAAPGVQTTQEVPPSGNGHGEDMYLSSPTSAIFGEEPDPMHEQRQGLAAQVAQAPRTPNRGSPNIGRKRSQNPALLRAAVTPGHSAKMAQIFHHAQITLRNDLQPSGSILGHPKKSKLPVLQRRAAGKSVACNVEGGNVGQAITAAGCTSESMATKTKQYISLEDAEASSRATTNEINPGDLTLNFLTSNSIRRRGLRVPIGGNTGMKPQKRSVSDEPADSTRDRVVADESTPPELGATTPGFGIWDDGDDSELFYARRPVALPTSMASKEVFGPRVDRSNVDKWLEDVLSASPRRKWRVPAIPGLDGDLRGRFSTKEADQGISRSISQAHETVQYLSDGETSPPDTDMEPEDSDKENQSPSDKRIASRYFGPQPEGPLQLRNSATPHKSRIPTLGEEQKFTPEPPFRLTHQATPRGYFLESPRRRKKTTKGAAVAPVPLPETEEVVKLSPDVDPYRKANRPRRHRCASYYDEDILTSPGKKGVLTESNMSRKLTRAMAFCEEAEDYEFTGVDARK